MLKNLENGIGPWVVKNRLWIILITLCYVLIPGYGLKSLYFESEYRNFIGDRFPSVIDMNFIEETFNRQENILFVIAPGNGDVFTRENLSLLADLTARGWKLPFSRRVDSLTNFQHTEAEGDDLIVEDLVGDIEGLTPEELARIKTIAMQEPRLVGNLISTHGDVTGVNIIFDIPDHDSNGKQLLVEQAREIVRHYREQYPDTIFYLNGTVVQDQVVYETTKGDLENLVPIVMVLIACILFVTIRNLASVILTLGVVALSVISALGIGSLLHIPITPPVAASPTIILTVSIANSVHVLVHFVQVLRHTQDRDQAVIETLRVNTQPVALACLTTTFGFLTLNFAETPPFRDLGNVVSIGVITSLFLSLITLPACLSFIPIHLKKQPENQTRVMVLLSGFIVRHQNKWLLLTLAVLIGSVLAAYNNVFNDNPMKYFKESSDYRVSTEFANRRLTGLTNLEFYLGSGEAGGISDPRFLQDVQRFIDWLEENPRVKHVTSLTDIMKRLNKNMHGDKANYYRLPESRDLAAQYLLLYEMSLPYGLDLANEINVDKSAIRLTVNLETPDDVSFMALQNQAVDWISDNAPNIKEAKASSLFFAYSSVSVYSSKALVFGAFLALSLISLLLVIAFRSLSVGLISFISNLAPAIVGFGIWGLLVGEIGGGTSIVAAVTIGIVVDDTVHVFSKYLRARREKNLGAEEGIRYSLETVGRALVVTSVVLVAGFMVLLFSDFRLNFEMGALTSMIISCALGTVFFLVPSLILKFPNIK